ncbi:MAG: type III-B CRISPR-associated protein Cas10/Cmr2 [Synergistaceae bacterium]|nr:type III-B CRISPR-associated protein Cas10/Cmr2 [Synergistaceae bacterium]
MNYLLQISVGPVQDFIAAARRTRDLWFGSNMLSEIAKAAAKSVKDSGGKLIFPAPEKDEDLSPGSDLSVANVILAEFGDSDGETLRAVSDKALEAAKSRLKVYADKVCKIMGKYIVKDRWDSQLDDIIEFYSAWVPADGDYHSARRNVGRLLAARKNIRDFNANDCKDRVPKSSLDGLRESVLIRNESDETLSDLPRGVSIKPNEALDAIGLIKRVPAGGDWVFPSVSRVALDAWIRTEGKEFCDDSYFMGMCEELADLGALSRARLPGGVYDSFPYDGVIFLPDRHASIIEDSRDKGRAKTLCSNIARYLEHKKPPEPYLAFICADGDKMGAALSAMNTPDEHRKFSQSLSRFALKARDIISDNHGICVYTGGDDVMAFIPLGNALDCARSLYDLFKETMSDYPDVSLSVGIAAAHAMENLEYLFNFGREAESIAKKGVNNKAVTQGNDRNGLAISVRSRGNIPFTVREQWKAKTDSHVLAEMSIEQRIKFFAERFINGEIPAKFPYELRENAKFYTNWKEASTLAEAVKSDVIRIFSRKDITLNDDDKKAFADYTQVKVKDAETMKEFADELILAQWISSGMTQGDDDA